jgi:hypothetical protein
VPPPASLDTLTRVTQNYKTTQMEGCQHTKHPYCYNILQSEGGQTLLGYYKKKGGGVRENGSSKTCGYFSRLKDFKDIGIHTLGTAFYLILFSVTFGLSRHKCRLPVLFRSY